MGDDDSIAATMVARHDSLSSCVSTTPCDVLTLLNDAGYMPLPPYIDRPDEAVDRELYQTVYGERPGAVAAPTAGLHFDEPLLAALRAKGVAMAFVITLHVGTGTFQPVRMDRIEQHQMHSEYAEVPQEVVDAVLACKARGNRIVAVGTTSVRSLESAAAGENTLAPFFGDTRIFIYPGYHFHVIDALITNFICQVHLDNVGIGVRRLSLYADGLPGSGGAGVPFFGYGECHIYHPEPCRCPGARG